MTGNSEFPGVWLLTNYGKSYKKEAGGSARLNRRNAAFSRKTPAQSRREDLKECENADELTGGFQSVQRRTIACGRLRRVAFQHHP
jgi:hypothetical protein